MTSNARPYEVLVIGAGINGLSTAYHLARLGCRHIGVVESFRCGHDRGSSHGTSRITRSTYVEAEYVRLAQYVRAEEWPRLECDAGRQLIFPCAGCFFGPPGGLFERYAEAVRQAGADVERLDVQEGRRRFPQFRFENCDGVLDDRTAGVVAASDTLNALYQLAGKRGVVLHEKTTVIDIRHEKVPIDVTTSNGKLRAERIVVTAGAWAAKLLPMLGSRLQVARQNVGFLTLEGDREQYQIGRFPVWVYLEDGENEIHYGLPEFRRPGIKLGRHVTSGRCDDPDNPPAQVEPAAVSHLEEFAATHFRARIVQCEGAEHCLYTNTLTEDFIIDFHPADRRIVIGAGFSGHGFKFGPLTGRILAELVLNGTTSLPIAETVRSRFALGQASENRPQ